MTIRAPGFGVGTEFNPGTSNIAREEPRPDPVRRVRDGAGTVYEIKPLSGPLRALASYRRVLRHVPFDGDLTND